VRDFVDKLARTGRTTCVVKPNQSAGTDHVFLCEDLEQAISAFHAVHGQINGLGAINDGALCQEYLHGTEYVVDGVSRDGVYKVVAVWEYDKRSVNGSNFVYFGMTLRDPSDPKARAVIDYAKEVVKGLKIYQGPSHMEIICDSQSSAVGADGLVTGHRQFSPCLVEVGTRCHGGEATWLPVVMECIGECVLCYAACWSFAQSCSRCTDDITSLSF
jgi:biotin carboxylase